MHPFNLPCPLASSLFMARKHEGFGMCETSERRTRVDRFTKKRVAWAIDNRAARGYLGVAEVSIRFVKFKATKPSELIAAESRFQRQCSACPEPATSTVSVMNNSRMRPKRG